MENIIKDPGLYLPSDSLPELISPVIQDYQNANAFVQSREDFADSISMPGDSITELINKVESYQAMSRELLSQPNPEIPVGPGYQFNLDNALNKLSKKINSGNPTLNAAAAPMNLGSKSDYDRYANSEDFQTFGYVPSLGSEQEYRYGRAMTWGDTMGKALAGGGALAWDTFVEGWKGWGRMAEALFTWDSSKLMGSEEERYQIAKEQEEIFNKYAIYNTAESEDSLLNRQFFGNMMQQAGFTVGALGQMILETYLTAGIGKAISASVGGIGKAKALRTAGTVGELINDTRKAQQVISNTQRVNNALKQIPRALVPMYGTVDDMVKAGRAGAGTLQLGMLLGGGIKREMSMFNMARSEAIFEAASTYKDLEDKLVNEFVSTNGREPNETELETIRKTADNASSDNFASNLGILTLMNRVQFGNMFKNFNTSRKIFSANATALGEDVFEVSGKVGDKTVKKVYEKGFVGRLGAVRDISKTFGRKKAAWEATKSMGLGLMKFEGSEGAQELLQEASNKGLSDYYYNLYHGNKGFGTKVDNVLSSIQNPLTDIDGAKTFLMGALTGRFIAPFSYAAGKAFAGKEGKDIAARKREAISIINTFYSDPTQYAKEWIANVKVQNRAAATMEEAVANGDRYTFYNTKDSAFAKAVSAAIKLNMYESLKDSLTELSKELNDQEFKEAFNLEPGSANRENVSQFMGKVVSQMDDYYTLYNNLKDKYGDRIVPELYRYNKPEEYERAKIAKIALDNAIEMLTTNVFKSRQSTKRAAELQQEIAANANIGASSTEILTKLGSEQSIEDHVNMLSKEISFYEKADTLDPEQRAVLKMKKQELKLAQAWKEAFEDVMTGQGESYFAEGAIKSIYQAYENLVNFYNKSEQKNVSVSIEDIEDNFTKFLDYIQLNKDSKAYVDAMNLLADPYNMKLIIEATKSSIDEMGKLMQAEHVKEVESIPDPSAPVTPENPEQPPAASPAASVANTPETPPAGSGTATSEPESQADQELEKALQAAYDKYKTEAEKAGNKVASYDQWKDFSAAAKDIRKKFEQKNSGQSSSAEIINQAKEKLRAIWNEIGNAAGRNAIEEGWAESFGYLAQALEVGGDKIQAHGMGKSSFATSLRDLFELFEKGIDSTRGGGQLYTAPLVTPKGSNAGAGMGTASGSAYTDGAFVLVAKKGVLGIKSLNDIGGILVNSGITDIRPEILNELRQAFPGLIVESYKDAKAMVEQLNNQPVTTSTSTTNDPYTAEFDVAAVNTETISTDVVDQILSSTISEKSDNFDSKADDFFNNLTVCNI